MKLSGDISIRAPQDTVFAAIEDARFFASCIDGVQDLKEREPGVYDAVFETKIAYIKFRFNISLAITQKDRPNYIEAKAEGTPIGIVGRTVASAKTSLKESDGQTCISYEIDASITGRLGSLGQPVLRAKAKEMEKQFTTNLRAKLEPTAS